jgi:TRAP-type C4-dicarboxylate transport system permease small subunit
VKRIVSFFVWVDKVFAISIEAMLVVLLLTMVVLISAQVVLRNFFNSGIAWSDVAARNMVLWVAFMGAMLATRVRSHVAIDILTRFIPRIPRNVVRIALDTFACIVTFLLARTALAFVIEERAMGSILFANIPTWIVETIIPFGFAMISLEYLIGIGLDIWRISTTTTRDFEAGKGRG